MKADLYGLPCFATDARLRQYDLQQANPDIGAMGIGHRNRDGAASHEFVLAAGKRTVESECT